MPLVNIRAVTNGRHRGALRKLAAVSSLIVVTTLTAALLVDPAGSQAPAGTPQRLVYQSQTTPLEPFQLEFADPGTGGAQVFATSSHPSRPDRAPLVDPTWSHDGQSIAFYENWSDGHGVVVKPASGGGETPLLPVKDFRPSWSPVAAEIAYWEYEETPPAFRYTLKVTTLPGGTTRTLAGPFGPSDRPLLPPEQPAWAADGKSIAFAFRRGIVTVPAAGGPLTALVAPGAPHAYVAHEPSFAPVGKYLAYVKSFEDEFGNFTSWQLVVRDLKTGQERIVAGGTDTTEEHGPQSWSPDGTRVAFAERRRIGPAPNDAESTLYIVRRDGTGGRRTLLTRFVVGPPSWGGSPLPSYYIKDIEVAQAIAPELSPITDVDPLEVDPYKLTWKLPAMNGFTMPLATGKPTLVRIYVGDASLPPGETARRKIGFRVETSTLFGALEGEETTVVTAEDVEPRQKVKDGSLTAVLPAVSARSGNAVRVEVEINIDQVETECDGCYPNGNKAQLDDVHFSPGGTLSLVPVPITLVDRSTTPPTRHPPSSAYDVFFGRDLPPLIPAPNRRIVLLDSPTQITWDPIVLPTSLLGGVYALMQLMDRLQIARSIDLQFHGPRDVGETKWVGYASPPSGSWGGLASGVGGCCFVTSDSTYVTTAHELGHTLGLFHRQGINSTTPLGLPLPYRGIGGVGYAFVDEGLDVGQIDQIFTADDAGDLMSYDKRTWTSPLTWERMFNTIREGSGLPLVRQPTSTGEGRVPALRDDEPAARTLRVVSGGITKNGAVIFDSTVVKTVAPASAGPIAGRIIAFDAAGHSVAATPVRGAPEVFENGVRALPFVVALPADASIATLVLRGPDGSVLAERHRSTTAPVGHFIDLPASVRANRGLTVHWAATDGDGNELSVMLFAHRGTRPWRLVAMGLPRSSAVVRPRSLGSSGQLQLRLLINDRFRTIHVDSPPIPMG